MQYADVRDQIHTGDLIAVRATSGIFPILTSLVTRSPYTHTAVALRGGFDGVDRLLVAQENGTGCSIVPLSQLNRVAFDVFDSPVARDAAEAAIWLLLGEHIGYGFTDIARIVANRLLGVPLPPADDDQLICSALSASIYLHAQWAPRLLPSIPAPCDLVAALGQSPKLEVRP